MIDKDVEVMGGAGNSTGNRSHTNGGVQTDLHPAFWIQVVECRLGESNVGQVHTWRFLCVCLRAVGLLRGGAEGDGGGGGCSPQSERNTRGRTGSTVEALLAQSVAGQISWRAVCRGCGTLQQRVWGGQATARLLSTPQFESIYVF